MLTLFDMKTYRQKKDRIGISFHTLTAHVLSQLNVLMNSVRHMLNR
jgi:hypothetical protein